MFLAIRELKYARGRFALISSVVFFMTVLIGLLSGLAGGLAMQNVSGILNLPQNNIVSHIANNSSEKTLTDSTISYENYQALKNINSQAIPIGITQYSLSNGNYKSGVSFFGANDLSNSPKHSDEIIVSKRLSQQLHLHSGDKLSNNNYNLTVVKVADNDFYAHSPIAWITLSDWQKLNRKLFGSNAYATIVNSSSSKTPKLINDGKHGINISSEKPQLNVGSKFAVLPLVGAFRSEIGSLGLMIALLFFISSLVVAAFFIIWTMQRRFDFSVLKALGAANKTLVADVLLQSLIILLTGAVTGSLVVALLGNLISQSTVPFMFNYIILFVPALLVVVTGLIGALVSIRPVVRSEALDALGSAS